MGTVLVVVEPTFKEPVNEGAVFVVVAPASDDVAACEEAFVEFEGIISVILKGVWIVLLAVEICRALFAEGEALVELNSKDLVAEGPTFERLIAGRAVVEMSL